MSKLAIVLCAAAFFASALATVLPQNLNEEDLKLRIDGAVTSIDKYIHELRTRADPLVQKPVRKSVTFVADFERNVTDYMDGVYRLMDKMVRTRGNVPNEMECRSYFAPYEKAVKDVVTNVDVVSRSAVTSTYNSLQAAIRAATDKRRIIKGFEVEATTCGQQCNTVGDTIDRAVADVSQKINAALKVYEKLIDGTIIMEAVHSQTKYDALPQVEDEAWNQFNNCVFSSRTRSSS